MGRMVRGEKAVCPVCRGAERGRYVRPPDSPVRLIPDDKGCDHCDRGIVWTVSRGDTFELTVAHVALLRAAYWRHSHSRPLCLEGKRPFGSSNVWRDIADLCGLPYGGDREDGPTGEQVDAYEALLAELHIALHVVMATASFEPGTYRLADKYDARSWRRVAARTGEE